MLQKRAKAGKKSLQPQALNCSPLLRLQPAAECNMITALTRSDNLKWEDDGFMMMGS